jgi:hypothetical protein
MRAYLERTVSPAAVREMMNRAFSDPNGIWGVANPGRRFALPWAGMNDAFGVKTVALTVHSGCTPMMRHCMSRLYCPLHG